MSQARETRRPSVIPNLLLRKSSRSGLWLAVRLVLLTSQIAETIWSDRAGRGPGRPPRVRPAGQPTQTLGGPLLYVPGPATSIGTMGQRPDTHSAGEVRLYRLCLTKDSPPSLTAAKITVQQGTKTTTAPPLRRSLFYSKLTIYVTRQPTPTASKLRCPGLDPHRQGAKENEGGTYRQRRATDVDPDSEAEMKTNF
jgi:hypothetical protein